LNKQASLEEKVNPDPETMTAVGEAVAKTKYTDLPNLLNIVTAAKIMGVSRDYAAKAIKRGDIQTAVFAGKTWVLKEPLLKKLGIPTD
jgi:hypothetical protein